MNQDDICNSHTAVNGEVEIHEPPRLHTISEYYNDAWEFLKNRWLNTALFSLVAMLCISTIISICYGIIYVLGIICTLIGGSAIAFYFNSIKDDESLLYPSIIAVGIIIAVIIFIIYLFFTLISILVIGPLNYGRCNGMLISKRKGNDADVSNLFLAKDNYANVAKVTAWHTLYVALWSLLFIIPGIIKRYSYALTYYIRFDNPELTGKECIELSMEMMEGHKMDLFLLHITFVGLSFIGTFTCGLANFFLVPFMDTIMAQFYEDVKAKYEYFKGNMD
jgi:uncharacterized membrane protein